VIRFFNEQWDRVPTVFLDTETTGRFPGRDRTVQVGVVRFERGEAVGSVWSYIDPGMPIPAEATSVHGITDDHVRGAPSLAEYFAREDVTRLLRDAQPGGYNHGFDKRFLPPVGDVDWDWPWVDPLTLIRKVDRFVRGKGKQKLAAACERHGVTLLDAHSAASDAAAAGQLFYKIGRQEFPARYTMGQLLSWQLRAEALEWERFHGWLSQQPPRPEAQP
jgi:DNA polymerase III subunit epsilon